MTTTALDICSNAFTELGVKPVDQDLSAQEGAWGLSKLNRLVSRWNTRRLFVYVILQNIYTIGTPLVTATPQYWSIGPTGADWTAARPVRIDSANLILTSATPYTYIPLPVVNTDEFAALRVPALTATIPTQLYYQPLWPNGRLYPWPTPTTLTNQIQLFVWNQIAEFASLAASFSFPPGYEDAITYSLAESMIPTYPNTASADLIMDLARRARADIQGPNSVMAKLITRDSGMPNSGRQRGDWNYLIGDVVGGRGN